MTAPQSYKVQVTSKKLPDLQISDFYGVRNFRLIVYGTMSDIRLMIFVGDLTRQ